MPLEGPLVDGYGRVHTDLRVSVTDRCNLRCVYCLPEEGVPFLPRAEILSFEEITRVASVLAGMGVEGIYAVSPPSGAALNVSLVSAADRACITITADVAAVPDSPKLAACIEDGFAEVCSVRLPGPPRST